MKTDRQGRRKILHLRAAGDEDVAHRIFRKAVMYNGCGWCGDCTAKGRCSEYE